MDGMWKLGTRMSKGTCWEHPGRTLGMKEKNLVSKQFLISVSTRFLEYKVETLLSFIRIWRKLTSNSAQTFPHSAQNWSLHIMILLIILGRHVLRLQTLLPNFFCEQGSSLPLLASGPKMWTSPRGTSCLPPQQAALIETRFKFTVVKNGFASYCEFKYL